MNAMLTDKWTSISQFKAAPSQAIDESEGSPFAILNRDKVMGYLVSPERMAELLESEENLKLRPIINERSQETSKIKSMTLDELFS